MEYDTAWFMKYFSHDFLQPAIYSF